MNAILLAVLVATAPPPSRPRPEPVPSVADLPLVEVPAQRVGTRLAVLFTGDGGWVAIDEEIAAELARAGVGVVGVDSLRYFWKKRTLDETVRDVARVIAHYRAAWKRSDVILLGYSRGADVVPFLASRLPDELRGAVRLVAMLGPGTFTELEVHVVDLFSSRKRPDALPTEDAVRATGGAVPMLCVHGTDEHDSLCPHLADLSWVKRVEVRGGHHFDRNYAGLARLVLGELPN
jgi:type IV secretory pathway VirJ component